MKVIALSNADGIAADGSAKWDVASSASSTFECPAGEERIVTVRTVHEHREAEVGQEVCLEDMLGVGLAESISGSVWDKGQWGGRVGVARTGAVSIRWKGIVFGRAG